MDVVLTVAQVVVFVYDVVTFPIYKFLSWVLEPVKPKSPTPDAYLVKESSEEIRWRRDVSSENVVYKEMIIDNKVDTVTTAVA